VAAMLQQPEICRRCSGGEPDGDHPLETIYLIVRVMRSLEDEDLAVSPVECGEAQPDAGIAELAITKLVDEKSFEGAAIIEIARVMPLVAQPRPYAAERSVGKRRKDLASSGDIEIEEFVSRVAGTQAEGEDAACRGACDKVEIRCN